MAALSTLVVSSIHKTCFILIVLAVMLMFYGYSYSSYMAFQETKLSEFMTSITSIFSFTESPTTPMLEPPGFSIYEDRAVLIIYIFAALLAFISLCLNIWHRIKKGKAQLFMPLTFASISVIVCITYVGYQIGLHWYA